jgi:hypothetical protein
MSALTVCPRVRGRHHALRQAKLIQVVSEDLFPFHSAITRTAACGHARGNDPESSATCRRASSAAAHIGQQLHASGTACDPRELGKAWRREVSTRPWERCTTRTRRSSTHRPHTTKASTGRQHTDRSSMTRAEHTPLVADWSESLRGSRFASALSTHGSTRPDHARSIDRRTSAT